MPLYRSLVHLLDNHGVRGVVRRVWERLFPSRARPSPVRPIPSVHPFDQAHGVDTSGFVFGGDIDTGSPADFYNTAYWAISPSSLSAALAVLPLDPAGFTFVDLGCGKGRALLVAAHHGFGRLLGVEISPSLAAIARANLARFPNAEVRTQDATVVEYPDTLLVIFLYHPFLAKVLRQALSNLMRQRATLPRELYILFANPSYQSLFSRLPAFQEIWTKEFPLSEEDAAADRHGIQHERYTLYKAV